MHNLKPKNPQLDPQSLSNQIITWGQIFGFQKVGITGVDLSQAEQHLINWLKQNYHGDMEWMARHGSKRSRPAELEPNTLSIISVRMDYLPPAAADPEMVLNHPELAYISRYALGRDYHKLMRKRLQKFAEKITQYAGEFSYRVFVDSAPVMEKAIAAKAGLGWQGKHSNILSREAGSWFFLGEIYTDLPLHKTPSRKAHCGECTACIDICPTKAIVAPYQVDARRCISYLTIESKAPIPIEYRPLIGNRIYGCDDCQLICPWNRFAQTSEIADFTARHHLDAPHLLDLFDWSEAVFLKKMEGSAIRRIGYDSWQRNIAVALGNTPKTSNLSAKIVQSLETKLHSSSELVKEHIKWALSRLSD